MNFVGDKPAKLMALPAHRANVSCSSGRIPDNAPVSVQPARQFERLGSPRRRDAGRLTLLNASTSAHGVSVASPAPSVDVSTSSELRTMTLPYRDAHLGRSVTQLATSFASFCALWAMMWVSLQYSYLVTLALAVPAAGCLVRLFILQHDCGHGSFFKSKRANDAAGRALSILTFTPYDRWRKNHAIHHATSGDLDRRGCGDVLMLTVREYRALSALRRWKYRLHRHPLILFGIGPLLYFVIFQRFTFYDAGMTRKERLGIYWTNLGLLSAGALISWLVRVRVLLMIHLPILTVAASAGAWLFYVQHHFEDTYWRRHDRWNYFDAGLEGSSYYT